jgi:GGDEF domain-containing protein
LSIGIAISPDDSSNSDKIVKFSDIAMYEAKRNNDCDYKFFD